MAAPTDNLFVVPDSEDGMRLDRAVAAIPSVGSRSRARKALESRKVTVAGSLAAVGDAGSPVPAGTEVRVEWNRPGTSFAHVKGNRSLEEAKIRILYEDEALIAVDKPAGLLSDSATRKQQKERDTLKKRLLPYLKAKGHRPWIVHRIDRDTSGIVLVAKSESLVQPLKNQFYAHTPERIYWTAVEGTPNPLTGTWTHTMRWDGRRRIQGLCSPGADGATTATAHYEVVHQYGPVSVLDVQLYTGRRNQIRLQAQSVGHPLIGERLYIPEGHRPIRPFPRQALHARRLTIKHPVSGDPLTIKAPLPQDLKTWLEGMRRATHSAPRRRK